MPSRDPSSVTLAIRSTRLRAALPGTPRVFLHLDQGLSPLRPLAPPAYFPCQLGDLLVSRGEAPWGRGRGSWVLPQAPLGPVPLATSSGVRSTGPPGAGAPSNAVLSPP